MDPVPALYYAAICAVPAFVAGGVRKAHLRVAIGTVVGLIAAALLPVQRAALMV